MIRMDLDEDEEVPVLVDLGTQKEDEDYGASTTAKVPLTIVTGYLGAGKTTLVNYILKEQHGKRIAVILNEFGDSADIEKALTISQNGQQVEEWLELANGCICCSIKDAGVAAIESLISRRGGFDYVILETSGLADPGNLAPLFWVDDGLGSSMYLDGIVTLVDAKNILLSLDDRPPDFPGNPPQEDPHHETTAHLQISHADVIVINKSDAVTTQQLNTVEDRVRAINGLAKIHVTQYGHIPQLEGFLLDLHAYDGLEGLENTGKGHSHLDPSISTTALALHPLSESQLAELESWLRSLLWESTLLLSHNAPKQGSPKFSIHRIKGRVFTLTGATKMIQGVRDVFEIVDINSDAPRKDMTEEQTSPGKIILIGRGLVDLPLQESLNLSLFKHIEKK